MVHIVEIMGHFTLLIILILYREYKGSIDTDKIASVVTIIEPISVWLLVVTGLL